MASMWSCSYNLAAKDLEPNQMVAAWCDAGRVVDRMEAITVSRS